MEVVTGFEGKDLSKCPRPCKECKPVCKGFKKLYAKDTEIIEYLRNEKELEREEKEREGRKSNYEEIEHKPTQIEGEFAATVHPRNSHSHNITEIKPPNNFQESQPKSKCFHCDLILQQVSGLLDEIKTIKESEVHGLCQHCKLTCFSGKCKRCYYLINKYLSDKTTQHKIRRQEYKMWLSKLKEVLLSVLRAEKVCRHKKRVPNTASSHELENLLRELKEPLFSRDLEIGQFPTSEFKDTFDISESLTENKDILEMVLKKLKNEGEILKKKKQVVADQTLNSSSLTGSLPSLRTKFEILQSKYAMQKKSMDSDFAFTSDRLELEFKTKTAKSLKQTATTQKVLQFGTSNQQKPTLNKPKSKDAEVESIMKKKGIRLKTGRTGVKKETSADGKKSYPRDISDEDRITVKDLEAAQIARVMKMKKQEQDMQTKKSSKISDMKGSTAKQLEIIQDTDNEVHKSKIPIDLDTGKIAGNKLDSEEAVMKMSSGLEQGTTGEGSGPEKGLDKEKLLEVASERVTFERLPVLAIEEIKDKNKKEDSTIDKKKEEELDEKDLRNEKETDKFKKGKGVGVDNQNTDKGKRKKKKKGKNENDEEELSGDDEVKKIKKKRHSGVSEDNIDSEEDKENINKLKPSESTKLLLKLLKQKEKEREKKQQMKDKEDTAKEKRNKITEKLKKKMEKATNTIIDTHKLGLGTHRRHKLGHVRSDFLMAETLVEDNEVECDDTYEVTEMIKGYEVVPFDSHYKNKPSDPEKPLFYKVLQELADTSPLESPAQSMTTVTPEKQQNIQLNYSEPNDDNNAKGIFRYALSKPEFIEKGYTKLPSIKVIRMMNVYKMVPTDPKRNWFERHKLERILFYDTGEKLAETDDDGHGRWYYKNGILALDYYKAEGSQASSVCCMYIGLTQCTPHSTPVPPSPISSYLRKLMNGEGGRTGVVYGASGVGYVHHDLNKDYYITIVCSLEVRANDRYVVYSSGENDAFGNPRFITVLACFDQLGNGLVYDHKGYVRLKYNQSEGIIIDDKIGPPGRWKWHSLNDPPVLQPIYLDTHINFKERRQSFYTQDQEQVKESKETDDISPNNDDDKMLAVEFDNFVKHRADKLKLNFESFQIRMKAFKINEQFSIHVVDQSKIFLMYRDGLVSMKLNLGMKLISSEIVDREVADVSEVHTPFDRDMPKSASVANIKRIIGDTKKKCRILDRK